MAAKDFINWVERRSIILRGMLSLGPLDVLDPLKLAQQMDVPVCTPYDILGLPTALLAQLLSGDGDSWSAGALPLPGNKWVILFNPTHPPTRIRATLMEELSHIFLKHPPSKIETKNGLIERTYKKSFETQAFWVGAAALLPITVMNKSKKSGITRQILANTYGVSIDLVKFRENVTRIILSP